MGSTNSTAVNFVFSSFLKDMQARSAKDLARMITSARAFCRRISSMRARFAFLEHNKDDQVCEYMYRDVLCGRVSNYDGTFVDT